MVPTVVAARVILAVEDMMYRSVGGVGSFWLGEDDVVESNPTGF